MLRNAESEDAERRAAQPATDDYTGEPCVVCGRIRVFLRNDGQLQCEKCDTFQPTQALTSEEWAVVLPHLGDDGATTPPSDHALAAVCLYGQPFGFTHEDVELLRATARDIVASVEDGSQVAAAERHGRELIALADRIAALLPPL